MQQHPLLSEPITTIAKDWQANAVITAPAPFKEIAKIGKGRSGARWMQDEKGHLVVVKNQLGKTGIANEKIVADLGRLLGLPVPPVRIWIKPATLAESEKCYAVSLSAFPDAKPYPSSAMLKADPFFPVMSIFHNWVGDWDRRSENIIYQDGADNGTPVLAYIDHTFAFSGKGRKSGKAPPVAIDDLDHWAIPYEEERADTLARIKTEAERPGSLTATTLRNIQSLSDQAIADIVGRVPDAIFSPEKKRATINMLSERRDGLSRLFPPCAARPA